MTTKQRRRRLYKGLCLLGPYDGMTQTTKSPRFLVSVMPRRDFITALEASADNIPLNRPLREETVEYVYREIGGAGFWVLSIFEFASQECVMQMLIDGYGRKGNISAVIMNPPFIRR